MLETSGAVTDRLSGLGFGRGLFAIALAGDPARPGDVVVGGKRENEFLDRDEEVDLSRLCGFGGSRGASRSAPQMSSLPRIEVIESERGASGRLGDGFLSTTCLSCARARDVFEEFWLPPSA